MSGDATQKELAHLEEQEKLLDAATTSSIRSEERPEQLSADQLKELKEPK